MSKDLENTEKKTVKKPYDKNKNLRPFQPGDKWTGNKNGRPKGQRNWDKIMEEAIIEIAEKSGKTPSEIKRALMVNRVKRALAGDYRFDKDISERMYGKVPIDLNNNVQLALVEAIGDIAAGGEDVYEQQNDTEAAPSLIGGQGLADGQLVVNPEQAGQDGQVQAQHSPEDVLGSQEAIPQDHSGQVS